MDDNDDPYELLGVGHDATPSQIKAAYRKAALRNHPDKVAPQDRETATLQFSKISNAYELLSDHQKRAAFDQAQHQQQHQYPQQYDTAYGAYPDPHQGFPPPHHQQHPHFHFHDPFEVFRHVFREEFGGGQAAPSFGSFASSSGDPFASMMRSDPFFSSSPFFGGRQSLFDDDPFFSSPMMGSGRQQPYGSSNGGSQRVGGGRGSSIFDRFDDMFEDMQQQQQQRANGSGNNNGSYSYSYSSSTTSYGGGPGGEAVTTQTTRRVVNGQEEESVTERIVHKPDGTVEREILDSRGSNTRPALPDATAAFDPHQQQQQQQQQSSRSLFPWRPPSRHSSSRRSQDS